MLDEPNIGGRPPITLHAWDDVGMLRRLLAIGFALAAVLGWSAPAAAHTSLVETDPAEGTSVDSPDSVRLVFSGTLLEIGTVFELRDADGEVFVLGDPEFLAQRAVQLAVPELPAGQYVLAWRVVADDGHPVDGELRFAVGEPFVPIVDDGDGTGSLSWLGWLWMTIAVALMAFMAVVMRTVLSRSPRARE